MRISDWGSGVCSSDLQDALEARRRLRVLQGIADQHVELVVDVVADIAPEAVQIDAARAQHRYRILVLDQGEEQVRSDERSVGTESVSTCRSRWSRSHSKKKMPKRYHEKIILK